MYRSLYQIWFFRDTKGSSMVCICYVILYRILCYYIVNKGVKRVRKAMSLNHFGISKEPLRNASMENWFCKCDV